MDALPGRRALSAPGRAAAGPALGAVPQQRGAARSLRGCRAAYYERYDPASLPRPASFDDDLAGRPAIYRRIQRVWQGLDWAQAAEATACYYALCSLLDDLIGGLLAELEALGLAENTMVVFTSDHGDYLGAHRLFLKGIPAFEEAYRVPLILAGPGIPAGRRVDQVVSLLDLPPTLTELLLGQPFEQPWPVAGAAAGRPGG